MKNKLNELLQRENESINRLINIENKINLMITRDVSGYSVDGHPDQFFGGKTFAQHGDDLIVLCLFHSIGIEKPSYLDIGAHHPLNISNTALLYKKGARGVNVEPNINLYANFEKMRPDDINLNIGVAPTSGSLTFYMIDDFSGRNSFNKQTVDEFVLKYPEFSIVRAVDVEVMSINQVVNQYCHGTFPDFLSIDVEGLDEQIIASADFSISKPKIICVEIENASGRHEEINLRDTLKKSGYYCVMRAVSNLIFIDECYLEIVGIG